jgi:hypothetical protein
MRARARAFALVALGLSPLGCAIYQADQIPLLGDGDVGGSDSAGTSGSSPTVAGGGQINAAGTTSGASGKATGGAPLGGTGGSGGESPVPPMGGEGGDGSEGGSSPGGSSNGGGGTGGTGGNGGGGAASGGNGGNGGVGGTPGTGGGGTSGTGGNGGSGGTPTTTPTCGDHPLSPVGSWSASASHDNSGANPASNMLDGKTTRWTTGKAQTADEWLQIDFGKAVSLSNVNLQQGNVDTNDYPRGYSVIVSDTNKNLNGTPSVSGMGKTGASTAIALPKLATGRYLLVKQTGSSLSWWSMNEIEVSCSD